MSHIIVSTGGGIVDTKLVATLRHCLSGGIANISAALENGSPLFDDELFVALRFDQFTKLRNLVSILQSAGIEPLIWEDGRPINARILLNIMQASDDSMAEFDRLSELGHEA